LSTIDNYLGHFFGYPLTSELQVVVPSH